MNQEPENPNALSLDELNLTPAWVKAPVKSYDRHPGAPPERSLDRDRDRRGPPRDHRDDRRREPAGRGGPRRDRSGQAPASRPAAVAPPAPTVTVDVTFLPNAAALTGLNDMIKQSVRAYALFDLAKLVLNKPERHIVRLVCKSGSLVRPVAGDGVFLTPDEALRDLFRRAPEKIFTRIEKAIEPPKGNFQFVNRCGLTGEILGPPNYHEYQSRLVKHHQQRLPHVPFEQFRARLETIRDPEVVKAWVEARSKTTEYTCLICAAPQVFGDRSELEKHVRQDHVAALVKTVTTVELPGPAARQIENLRLLEAVRQAWESERRFPLKTVNELRPHLSQAGFSFFKHKKGITYISCVKPNRFDSLTHLSVQVQNIMTFLRAHENATRKQLAEHLAPVNETLLAADLHWLIQDGYVVEFYDGKLWALEDKLTKPATPAAAAAPQVPAASPVTAAVPPVTAEPPAPAVAAPEIAAPPVADVPPVSDDPSTLAT